MWSLAQQLKKDYRGVRADFAVRPYCGDVHAQACGPVPARPEDVAPFIVMATRVFGGTLRCVPVVTPCPGKDKDRARFLFAFITPRIVADTAWVSVMAFESLADLPGADDLVSVMERYLYRLTRPPGGVWTATARFFESRGHYYRDR